MGERLWTVLELVQAAATLLEERGFESPKLEADLLLAHVLGVERLSLYQSWDMPVDAAPRAAYRELIKRRLRHEPVAYITGERGFLDATFKVRPGVLIPRPETEHLVEASLALLASREHPRFLEIGTGSGCVIGSLAAKASALQGVGIDVSGVALAVTDENLLALGVRERVDLREGDLFGPLRPGERFHLVVSNPPYITEAERAGLPADVRDFEPGTALFSPADALHFHRLVLDGAVAWLEDDGAVALELPGTGAQAMREHAAARHPGLQTAVVNDYAGRERVFVASRAEIPSEIARHSAAGADD